MLILRKHAEPLLQERDYLSCHPVQAMDQRVSIHIAETSTHRVVDEQYVRELIPATFAVPQSSIFIDPVRPNLHQRTIHTAATRPAVEPNDGALSVRNVSVLEEPEEEVAMVLRGDFDVAGVHLQQGLGCAW